MLNLFIAATFIFWGFNSVAAKVELSEISSYEYSAGQDSSLKLEKDHNVFMFFSASCPCSQSYFEYLNKLSKDYSGFGFIGFHSSKFLSEEIIKNYFKDKNSAFPIFEDSGLAYADKFGALKTPHVFVLDKKGEVVYHGAVADSRHLPSAKIFHLENALKDIKNGNRPKVDYAKALGCYIAR